MAVLLEPFGATQPALKTAANAASIKRFIHSLALLVIGVREIEAEPAVMRQRTGLNARHSLQCLCDARLL